MTPKKRALVTVSALLALVLSLGMVWVFNRPRAAAGSKSLLIEVFHGDGSRKAYPVRTDAETLRQACEEHSLITGRESEYGLYVLTVDGETADETRQQWWCITKDGAEHNYGVDATKIRDGEQYAFTLKTGW